MLIATRGQVSATDEAMVDVGVKEELFALLGFDLATALFFEMAFLSLAFEVVDDAEEEGEAFENGEVELLYFGYVGG